MPSPSTAKWPPPKSEDEWEDMVLDAMRIRWSDPNAQRNGRRGQRQYGVDISGRLGSLTVAAQAKNTELLSEAGAIAEIQKAELFRPALSAFYLAIGGPRNATFQEFIRLLSAERVERGNFEINVLFFDDVCHDLAISPELVRKYWGSFITELSDALSSALSAPVLDAEVAFAKIWNLPQVKAYAEYLESVSDGEVRAQIRIEKTPQLDGEKGTIERSWIIAVAESQETRTITSYTIAVDVDSGSLRFYSVLENRWLVREEWLKTGDSLSFNFV